MERENIGRIMPRFLKTVNCNDSNLQQYENCELPDVQAGFRKGRGTKIKLSTSAGSSTRQECSRKNIYFCFVDYAKAFDTLDHNKMENS